MERRSSCHVYAVCYHILRIVYFHTDLFLPGQNIYTKSILTTLVANRYLTSVESGGSTVFPRIGVDVVTRKNDAIFWGNLLPSSLGRKLPVASEIRTEDGESWSVGNSLTLHGGCPVWRGNKWVANKWLHEAGNHKCWV